MSYQQNLQKKSRGGAFSTCLLLSSEDFLLAALDTVPGASAALHQLLPPATEVPPESAGARGAFCKARRVRHLVCRQFLGPAAAEAHRPQPQPVGRHKGGAAVEPAGAAPHPAR